MAKRRDWSKYSFKGVPTRVMNKEIERRASLAYAYNVNREIRAIQKRDRAERGQ